VFSFLPRAHAALFAVALLLAGCAAASRPLELEDVRTETPVGAVVLFDANGQTVDDESLPAIQGVKDELNVLALSGGGADGAFGAGLLTGWSESGKRPRFDVVTGVSTGALMATLAFIGPEYDAVMKDVYTTIKNDDIYKEKGLTSLLSDSLLDSTPLKKKIEAVVTNELLDKVATEYRAGRRLYVATTNLDSGQLVVWDMGAIAASGSPTRARYYQNVLRASAAVPGYFKPVYIQPSAASEARQMHVDGGVKAPVLLRSFMLKQPAKKRNVYIVVNGHMKLVDADSAVKPEVMDISRNAIEELLRGLLARTVYQGYVTAKQANAGFRLIYMPDNAPAPENALVFDPEIMRRQFELGREFGRSGTGWITEPPRIDDFERIN
jgi:predicted acylesterase/phospholipase RssA